MKRISRFIILTAFICVVLRTPAADADSTLSWHFAGTDAVLKSNPESVWSDVSTIRPASTFLDQIKNKIATWLPGRLNWKDNDWRGTSPFIHQFLDELIANESFGRFDGADISEGSWVVAVHLTPEQEKKWVKDLFSFGRLIKWGEPKAVKIADLSGWTISDKNDETSYSFFNSGGWVIVGNNFDAGSFANDRVKALLKDGRPVAKLSGDWLTTTIDPAIMDWSLNLPSFGPVRQVSASFSWKDSSVGMAANVLLENNVSDDLQKWLTPKEIILDPLVSFTALRGIEDWIGTFAAAKSLPAEDLPNQMFSWTRGNVAFIEDFALPVPDADKAFTALSKSVPKSYNETIMDYSLGEWISATNTSRLLWRGLPVFVPYLDPVTLGDQGYIQGGIFPLMKEEEAKPAPQALFDQIEGRDDLIYYDWEISAARIQAFNQATRFASLIFGLKAQQEQAQGAKWMMAISDKLQNAITEATVSGPRELAVVRKSSLGFTGIELWMLTHWLDGKDFPTFPYNPPVKRSAKTSVDRKPMPKAERIRP